MLEADRWNAPRQSSADYFLNNTEEVDASAPKRPVAFADRQRRPARRPPTSRSLPRSAEGLKPWRITLCIALLSVVRAGLHQRRLCCEPKG